MCRFVNGVALDVICRDAFESRSKLLLADLKRQSLVWLRGLTEHGNAETPAESAEMSFICGRYLMNFDSN